MRREHSATTERMTAFSDGVFAVIITILVLELRPPHEASVAALLELWPTAVSYAVSCLSIAIVWNNHHYLLRFADFATGRLIWINFAHLFAVSLMPFSTAWIASTRLSPIPVSFYAGVFVVANVTYLLLRWETVDRTLRNAKARDHAPSAICLRCLLTLAAFMMATVVSLRYPIGGMAIICLCLLFYLSPGILGQDIQPMPQT